MNAEIESYSKDSKKSGSALLVALWSVIILSLLVAGFAFEMNIEAGIISHARKRMKARYLARAGIEWSKAVLARRKDVSKKDEDSIAAAEDNEMDVAALHLSRGMGARSQTVNLGDGTFTVDIVPESAKRNVNLLSHEDWEELLDITNVPEDDWPELIDCFGDWVDKNDLHLLNGAEQDDPYYADAGIKVKNAAIDTVDELLLIKNFSASIVYGGPAEDEDDPPLTGIAEHLTTWGNGKVNINDASREVLLTLTNIADDFWIDAIIELRKGDDGEAGTVDDGFKSVEEAMSLIPELAQVRGQITTRDITYLRITSVGEVNGVKNVVWCIMRVKGKETLPVYWHEGPM